MRTAADARAVSAGRLWRLAAAAALLIVTFGQVGPSTGAALGPVIAITPDEVIPNGFVGDVFIPSVSGRGQAVGVHDHEVREDSFVLLDVPGPEPMARGHGTAVSGNGCVALWSRDNGNTDPNAAIDFGITNRCTGIERVIGATTVNYDFPVRRLALSFDGRFAAVEFASCFACEFVPNVVVRIDTETLEQRVMPVPTQFYGTNASLGLDISDDGNTVVTVVTPSSNPAQAVVAWNVATNDVSVVSTLPVVVGNIAAFPSVSGDGRFVSFASTDRLGRIAGRGPWVYVRDRVSGSVVRISGVTDGAYYSSLSGDGSQVAYGVTASSACSLNMTDLSTLEGQCPTTRIDVAFSATPGLSAGVSFETISLNTAGAVASGLHAEPDLSANGRWVSWVSDNGIDLVGTGDLSRFKGRRQAFLRRRDGGLAINPNPVDFGTIGASTSLVQTATVTNTGRSSVIMDSIAISGSTRFTPAAGGTCVQGASLPPGASCTINVQFAAPGNTSTTTASLFVGETQFDPISATARLIGRSSFTPPPTTTTTLPPTTITTTTTTVVGQVSPTTTSTTTIPTFVQLDAQPNPVDFGAVAVGIPAPFQVITVTNLGTGSGLVTTEMLGANPDDFFVSDNQCSGATLGPGQSCTITVTMIAQDGGTRSAALTITSGGEGGDVALTGQGRFAPRMFSSPAAVTERGITTILGQGFPPGDSFTVRFLNTTTSIPVVADGQGMFRIPFTPLGKIELGAYVLQVDGVPGTFDDVKTQLVVVLPTFEPQGPGGPAFGEALIVTRGG